MEVEFQAFDHTKSEVIYEDRSLEVLTIPLHHRVPCAGFLFREKQKPRHLLVEECQKYNIPTAYYQSITLGNDWTDGNGTVIPNASLTTDPSPSKSYAYCSDTIYAESIVPVIKGCDLLYHEATFANDLAATAKERGHSTALEAGKIASLAQVKQLVIGHFSSRYDGDGETELLAEAKSVFENTELAKERKIFEL